MNLEQLVAQFPVSVDYNPSPGCYNHPLTGKIPMGYFRTNETLITAMRKALPFKTRLRWRGPRATTMDSSRQLALGVVIYTLKAE